MMVYTFLTGVTHSQLVHELDLEAGDFDVELEVDDEQEVAVGSVVDS